MRKGIACLMAVLFCVAAYAGQNGVLVPQNPPTDVQYVDITGGGNSALYPWYTSATSCRAQMLFKKGSLIDGNIVQFGLRNSNTNKGTFYNVTVRMCYTDLEALTTNFSNNYGSYTPQDVFTASELLVGSGVAGAWDVLSLTVPFNYSASTNLIVEIVWTSWASTTVNTYRKGVGYNGFLYASNHTNATGTPHASEYDARFGFEEAANNPNISDIARDIVYPFSWEQVEVNATITPPSGEEITLAQIDFSTDLGNNWTSDDYDDKQGDVYYFTIPPANSGDSVFYRIHAQSTPLDGEATSGVYKYQVPFDVSISELQLVDTLVRDTSDFFGKRVHVSGVVTGVPTQQKFFVGEAAGGPWSGLYVYRSAGGDPVALGDSIDINGVMAVFSGLDQIVPSRIDINGTGQAFDTTLVTIPDARQEAYEGVLIKLEELIVLDSSGTFNSNKIYQVASLAKDAVEVMPLYVTADSPFAGAPIPAGLFNLICNISEHNSTAGRQLVPRYREDVILVADISAEQIVAPTGTVLVGTEIIPVVRVANLSLVAAAPAVTVRMKIPGTGYDKVQTISLDPAEEKLVAFEKWVAVIGSYLVEGTVSYVGDPYPSNDKVTTTVSVVASAEGGWEEVASLPQTPTLKPVKDGGWLAVGPDKETDAEVIYATKGNKTTDFYKYNPSVGEKGTWYSLTPVPEYQDGKKKPPAKGTRGISDGERYVYMTRGNNMLGFWKYDIQQDTWTEQEPIPLGDYKKKVKGGEDMVYVHRDTIAYVYLLKGAGPEFYRFNITTGKWESRQDAPFDRSKSDKGSFLVYDGDKTVYAHQAKRNDGQNHYMYKFDLVTQSWSPTAKKGIPVYANEAGKTKKKKAADGSAGAWKSDGFYATKGGNTQSFFKYSVSKDTWTELDNIPALGSTMKNKRIKAGGDLVALGTDFFAFKGNKTYEFWKYAEGIAYASRGLSERDGVAAGVIGNGEWRMGIGPNPLSSGFATLRYSLPNAGPATVTVFDIAGRSVFSTRSPGHLTTGSLPLDLRKLSAGVYLVKLESDNFTQTQKLVVQK